MKRPDGDEGNDRNDRDDTITDYNDQNDAEAIDEVIYEPPKPLETSPIGKEVPGTQESRSSSSPSFLSSRSSDQSSRSSDQSFSSRSIT